MADTLAVDLSVKAQWLFSDALDLSTVADASQVSYARSLSDGTGADQADKIWHDSRTVSAGASDDLDMTALPQSIFGGTINISLSKVKALLIVNTSTTTGDQLRVGGAPANSFSAPFNGVAASLALVGPDSPLLLSNKRDGWTVTPGTGDILRIHNPTSNAITYRIVIVGVS